MYFPLFMNISLEQVFNVVHCSFQLDSLGNLGDPIELLSYLGPSEPGDNNASNNNTSGNQSNNNSSTNNNEDILSFFESWNVKRESVVTYRC